MNCSACGHENPQGSKFCIECGQPFAIRCAQCGSELPAAAKFCNECGRPVTGQGAASADRAPRDYTPKHLADKILQSKSALEGERKQVTVLFADVKGSMELAEQVDAEEWHRILDRFFQILTAGVHRFEGTVNQYTGDGIMALFGAPIAHEDHAQRACWTALYLRQELRSYGEELRRTRGLNFSVRMGINSGEVVVGKIGDDLRMDYTAQGQVVNLAQRIEQLAAPESAYLTENTAALVSGFFELRDLEEFRLKGVAEPVHVYELEGVGALRTRLDVSRARGFSRFVGRVDEMATLELALNRAQDGDGQVVGVVGQAGVGKSRLCLEFVERCRARGMRVVEAHCPAHGRTVPLLPILELLRNSFGITAREGEQATREKIAGRLLLLDRAFDEVLPLVFDFLRVPDPARAVARMDPDARQRQLYGFLRRLVQARSEREPAVLLFDDVQWIDAGSDAFLTQLADVTSATRTLLLLNFRPEYHAQWMGRSYYQQLALSPLGAEASDELLGELLGKAPTLVDLRDLIRDRTAGNPFFIEEVLQSLVESGTLTGTRGAYRLTTPIQELAIPATVQSVLAARIDRLPEREKRVLQTAAVIGKEFAEPILAVVAELPASDLTASLSALQEAEFIYLQALFPVAEYVFKHPLTQEVVLASQLEDRRQRLHVAVARAIEQADPENLDKQAALLAHHWEEAGERIEAARAHTRAARRIVLEDFEDSIRCWHRVCELVADLPETPETIALELRASSWLLYLAWPTVREHQQVRDVFTRAQELARRAGNEEALVEIQTHFGRLLSRAGSVDEAEELIRDAHQRAAGIERPRIQGEVTTALADLLVGLGRCEEALAEVRRSLALLSPVATITTRSQLLYCEADALFWLGRPQEGLRVAQDGLALALSDADPRARNQLTSVLSLIAELTGDWEAALDRSRSEVEQGEGHSTALTLAWGQVSLGIACLLAGQPERAKSALDYARGLGGVPSQAVAEGSFILLQESRVHLALGDLVQAEKLANGALAHACTCRQVGTEAWCRIQLASVALATGDGARIEEAREQLDLAAGILERTDLGCLQPLLHLGRAELARLTGDSGTHKQELAAALQIYQGWGNRREVERITRELES